MIDKITNNIKEQTCLSQQLEESEERFQATFNQAAVGIAHVGLNRQCLLVNQKLCDIVGYSREELVGLTLEQITHPDDLNLDEEYIRQILAGEIQTYVLEKRYVCKNNTLVWMNENVSLVRPTFSEPYFIYVFQDITPWKQTQEELQQAYKDLDRQAQERTLELQQVNEELQTTLQELQITEEELRQQNEELAENRHEIELERRRYEDLFEFAPDGYLVTDLSGNILEANLTAATMLSIDRQRLIGKPLTVFIAKQERQSFRIRLTYLQHMEYWETYLEARSGRTFPIMVGVTDINNDKGERVGIRWLLRDISTLKHIEQRLQAAYNQLEIRVEERTAELFHTNQLLQQEIAERKQAQQKIQEQAALLNVASDAILVRNLEDEILFWNQAAESLYGWQNGEVLGKKATELFCPDMTPEENDLLKIVLEQGKWEGELQHTTKEGKKIIVLSRWTLVRNNTGQPQSILTVNTDITEKKQLEAQFYQIQRLESLGTLASGIAHDLNNILSPILAVAQLLPFKLPNVDDKTKQLLKILEDSSQRCTQLVKQITAMASPAEGKRAPRQLDNLIKEVERITSSTFPKSIEICTQLEPNLWTVLVDETQIHQVLMNLCVNARDAMPQGGSLSICVENFLIDQNYAKMNLEAHEGPYVVITVADTGCGMPQEVLSRIFEPFFTTKEQGKGTGLGLSTTLAIIKNHGGFVNANSEVGEGSEFKVYLPAIEDQVAQQEADSCQMFRGNNELILVVDDEEFIRQMSKISLEEQNYRILTARDAVDAFSLYTLHKNEISLVLVDIQMPSIDGLNVIRVLQQINSSVKIIVMSGLASNHKLLETSGLEVQAFLLKPYTTKELLTTIKGILSVT